MQTVAGRREESSPWLPVTTTQSQVSTEGNLCHPLVLTLAGQDQDVELMWKIVTMHHGVHECNEKTVKIKTSRCWSGTQILALENVKCK